MKGKWIEEMRRKLEGHRKAPPEGLWEGISEQMGFKPEKAIHPASAKRWYWAAAAAVLLTVGFFTFYHHESKEPSSLATTMPSSEDTLQAEPMIAVAEMTPPRTEEETHAGHATATPQSKVLLPPVPATKETAREEMKGKEAGEKEMDENQPTVTGQDLAADVHPVGSDENDKSDKSDVTDQPDQPLEQRAETSEKKTLPHEADTPPSPSMASMEPLRRQPSSTGKWTMGLQASGGLLASNNHNGTMDNNNSMMAANYYFNGKTLFEDAAYNGCASYTEPETTHSKHHLPVRFGMSLQYQLNDRLALLSGINYSQLYSEFTKGNSTTDQHLHYLGVPVGVAWKIWSNQRLQCYLSGNVMLEKCLNEKPWQWSVDAGAGAEYAITRQVGLYLEPSLGYHFDDGTSFEHYYKDHPLAPSIMFGLRMHVK